MFAARLSKVLRPCCARPGKLAARFASGYLNHTMSETANLATADLPFSVRLRHFALRVVLCAAGYIAFSGSIYVCELLGNAWGIAKLGILGLALNIAALAALLWRLRRQQQGVANALGPVLALLIVILLFAAIDVRLHGANASFWTVQNLRTVAVQTSPIAVAALGMTLIIIAGGIDLSAGTAVALSATVLAWCLDTTWDSAMTRLFLGGWHGLPLLAEGLLVVAALAASVLTGCLTGTINGALISWLRLVPFIITLGTMTAYLGFGKILAGQSTIHAPRERIPAWVPGLVDRSPDMEWISWPLLPNFASGVWLALLLAIVTAVVLHLTVFGRRVFAIGSSESTARLCGINVTRTKIAVYLLAGLFVGIAGIYQFARLGVGNPASGIGLELKIIAAVVIGGGSLNGGQGSVVGTLAGAAIMLVIASGCTMLELANATQDIIIGGIIVAAVAVDKLRQRQMES